MAGQARGEGGGAASQPSPSLPWTGGAAVSHAGQMQNTLFFGDNLDVLRGRDADGRPLIPDERVDLIYLDPPFNSAATYNVLFKAPDGGAADSQIEAFEDSWHWGEPDGWGAQLRRVA